LSSPKKKKAPKPVSGQGVEILNLTRRGMPAKDSIRKVVEFVSPQNERYKIIKTTETDPYDQLRKTAKETRRKT
jgi:hypothetical protein